MKHGKSEIKDGAKAGFWAGILAALCCIGPLVIVLFGLGSVSFALSLGQYKSYFLGLGFLFMIVAIVLHLKKKNKTCDVNYFSVEGLKKERKFIVSVVLSMGVIYVLVLYVLVPAVSPTIYGNTVPKTTQLAIVGNPVNENVVNTNHNMRLLNVKISGMDCAGCASGVQSILKSLEGVIEAKVNYPEGTGEIIYNPELITKEKLINSDAFSTYPAEVVSDEKLRVR